MPGDEGADTVSSATAYQRRWRAANPGYHKAWRAAHPDGERARAKRWRDAHPERDHGKRKPVVVSDIPEPWSHDHPLIARAWAVMSGLGYHRGPHGRALSFLEDEMLLDAIGVAVLAQLTRKDPDAAVRSFLAVERNWRVRAAPYLLDGDVFDD